MKIPIGKNNGVKEKSWSPIKILKPLGISIAVALTLFIAIGLLFPKASPTVSQDESIKLIISEKAYDKLKKKREEAIAQEVLLASDDDFVKASFKYKGKIYPAKIRLKGDWTDHLKDERTWSFRIEMKGENTFKGMKKFSVHHPKTRNYIHEWLFHRAADKLGLINLRYGFANIKLRVKKNELSGQTFDLGLYAYEESFEKRLIEYNQHREGVILKFDENMLWKDRAQSLKVKNWYSFNPDLGSYWNSDIRAFGMKKILSDSTLFNYFTLAKNMLERYRRGEISQDQVFDLRKMAQFNALSNMMGGEHGMIWHNARWYYNPITSLLEPITFDAQAGNKVNQLTFSEMINPNDSLYRELYAAELENLLSTDFWEEFYEDNQEELDENLRILREGYSQFEFDTTVISHNRHVIDKFLYPSTAIKPHLNSLSATTAELNIRSLTNFDVEVVGISIDGKRSIAQTENSTVLRAMKTESVRFTFNKYYKTALVNKKGKSLSLLDQFKKISVEYRILGTTKSFHESIVPFTRADRQLELNDLPKRTANAETFDFLEFDEESKMIKFKGTSAVLSSALIIPKGYTFYIGENCALDIREGGQILSYSPLKFSANGIHPSRIFSSDGKGKGIVVMNTSDTSIIEHFSIEGLSAPSTDKWSMTGAVSFYQSHVIIKNTVFSHNVSEDALNIIRSSFVIEGAIFKQIYRDAFDGDFVKGRISNSQFKVVGNDAIDVSGSDISVNDLKLERIGDKGISIGENSKLNGQKITVSNSEIAIAGKDLSQLSLDNISITNCQLGFTAFQKKSEFGPSQITATNVTLNNNVYDDLIERNSQLTLNGKKVKTIRNVKDKLYGVEMGTK
jgi:hypothetical protein